MSRNARRGFAFTMVELLVAVAIIGILAGLIAAALPFSRERARRVSCVNNLRQFGTMLHLYGNDNADRLPTGISEHGAQQLARQVTIDIDEHVPIVTAAVRSNLVQLASGNEAVFTCPNLRAPFNRRGGYEYPGYGVLLGYNYLGGHRNTPWATSGYATTPWISPQRLSDDPQLVVLTDLNTFPVGDKASFVPHTRRGSLFVGGVSIAVTPDLPAPNVESAADLHPARFGGQGGNLARLDGSVSWRKMTDMKVHVGSPALREAGAFCVW